MSFSSPPTVAPDYLSLLYTSYLYPPLYFLPARVDSTVAHRALPPTIVIAPLPTSLLPTGPGRQHRRPPRPPADNCYRTTARTSTSFVADRTLPPSIVIAQQHGLWSPVLCSGARSFALEPGPLLWGLVLCSGARSFALARRPIAPSKPPGPAPEPRDSHTAGRPCCSETSSAPCARSAPGTVRPPPPSS